MPIAQCLRLISNPMERIVHAKKRLFINYKYWRTEKLTEVLPKVFIYDLPKKFNPNHELSLVSETYFSLYDFFRLYCRTYDPSEADYFFVPINIIQYQFRNENPDDLLKYLKFLDPNRNDHLVVALGDFSQRSKKNHAGLAYLETYDWLNDFVLLALESSSDLIPGQDIGIIPYNTLSTSPLFNNNQRTFLYSFLGETSHIYLLQTHIRNKIKLIPAKQNNFIGSYITSTLRKKLLKYYYTKDDYELLSRNSVFTLAPAGYGRWTYRFFQAIQWGSIPVLLSDDYAKPFEDTIPYDDFCITIPEKDVHRIDEILNSFSLRDIEILQNALQNNLHHFTQEAFFYKLCSRLKKQCGRCTLRNTEDLGQE